MQHEAIKVLQLNTGVLSCPLTLSSLDSVQCEVFFLTRMSECVRMIEVDSGHRLLAYITGQLLLTCAWFVHSSVMSFFCHGSEPCLVGRGMFFFFAHGISMIYDCLGLEEYDWFIS